MSSQALIDLSPLWQLLLLASALAALAAGWLWLRQSGLSGLGWLRALTLLTLFLSFDLVLFGAFTRLSDSGLGCPDWPGCYASASPVGARAAISAAESAMPSGPVTHTKAWIEMVHRYMAGGVGALILLLAAATWRERLRAGDPQAQPDPWLPTLTLLWVCVQGAFGALTVTMKLFPAIVTLHLLGGLLLLVLLGVQAERLGRQQQQRSRLPLDRATRALLLLGCAALALQLALGGWVSTNYAVLACTDFPQCQASWWPDMRFDQGFQIWRELGLAADGSPIRFEALTAIHVAHRLMAFVVVALLGLLAWRLGAVAGLRTNARWLAALLLMQFASGLANVLLGWPLAAALAHTAGAAALAVVLGWTVAATAARPRTNAQAEHRLNRSDAPA